MFPSHDGACHPCHVDVGVHVRAVDPLKELPALARSAYPQAGWEQLRAARNAMTKDTFAAAMDAQMAIEPGAGRAHLPLCPRALDGGDGGVFAGRASSHRMSRRSAFSF